MESWRRVFCTSLGVVWVVLVAPAPAPGQEEPARGPGTGACHADVQRLCNEAKGTPRGVASCLREHVDELSDGCREQIESGAARMRGMGSKLRAACGADLAEHCPGAGPGPGMVRCLREHEAELSEGCRTAIPERRGPGRPAP
ncbi:MAG: cysteine rich repeat-containing protein [Myxococcota bacterium]|nr:cysteine rich repeat-containing protein [Myxococcota bacterium]